jgi:hypothetical protein
MRRCYTARIDALSICRGALEIGLLIMCVFVMVDLGFSLDYAGLEGVRRVAGRRPLVEGWSGTEKAATLGGEWRVFCFTTQALTAP